MIDVVIKFVVTGSNGKIVKCCKLSALQNTLGLWWGSNPSWNECHLQAFPLGHACIYRFNNINSMYSLSHTLTLENI